jgi:hypothetical protein
VTTSCLADRAAPGELLRLVADGLTGAGLEVRPPGDGEGCRLDIAWPGARCTLTFGECGNAEWEYCPGSPQDAGALEPAEHGTLTQVVHRISAAIDARPVDLDGAHQRWPGWRFSREGEELVARSTDGLCTLRADSPEALERGPDVGVGARLRREPGLPGAR